MSSKKRSIAETASAPDSNKRITRSSTRAQISKVPASDAESSRNSKRKSTTPAAPSRPRATKRKADTNISENDSLPPSNTGKSLTISSHLVKAPIQCTMYHIQNPTSTSMLIFTHGAGGTLSAPAVNNFCTGFSTVLPILAFQGSMNLASRVKGFRAAIGYVWSKAMETDLGKRRLVLGGRSMGARAAVMAASEVLEGEEQEEWGKVELVLVSYPLQGPKHDLRDKILLSLPAKVNVLFIVGDRDAMCPLGLLNEMRSRMAAKSQLVVVKGADHGMHTKPAGVEKERGEETGRIAAEWLEGKVLEDELLVGEEG